MQISKKEPNWASVIAFVFILQHNVRPVSTIGCSNRYEFRNNREVWHEFHSNCSELRKVYPGCQEEIVVSFAENAPYATWNAEKKIVEGLIAGMLEEALETCCYKCSKLKYIGPNNRIDTITNPNASVLLPVQSATTSKYIMGRDYIPLVDLHSVIFLAKDKSNKGVELTLHLFTSVLNTWPLFIIAFLMAMVAGCIVWVLDMWFNRNDFPTSFPKGPFEGFWWAFVSMTTVGYGDHAPKSLIAKLFAIFWIMIGITIFSMYTATLSSALTANIVELKDTSIDGQNVAGFHFSSVAKTSVKLENANFVPHNDIDQMISSLKNDKVDAVVIDENLAKYYKSRFAAEISDIQNHHSRTIVGTSYGIAIQGNNELANFFRTFFETNQDNKLTMLNDVVHKHWPDYHLLSKHKVDVTTYFSMDSPIFIGTLITLIIMFIMTIGVGFTCKWVVKKHSDVIPTYIARKIVRKKSKHKGDDIPMILADDKKHALEKCMKELDQLRTNLDAILNAQDSNTA